MDNARLKLAVLLFPTLNENFTVVDDLDAAPALPPFADVRDDGGARRIPDLRAADESARAPRRRTCVAREMRSFPPSSSTRSTASRRTSSRCTASSRRSPKLGVLPNLGYFVTVNLSVPVWDWGGLRSKLRQSEARQRAGAGRR